MSLLLHARFAQLYQGSYFYLFELCLGDEQMKEFLQKLEKVAGLIIIFSICREDKLTWA